MQANKKPDHPKPKIKVVSTQDNQKELFETFCKTADQFKKIALVNYDLKKLIVIMMDQLKKDTDSAIVNQFKIKLKNIYKGAK